MVSWSLIVAEWKNNPLIVAVLSGSAVLTTTLFIVFTYVMPVYQKEDSNKISELQNQINNKNTLIKEITKQNNDTSVKNENDLQTLSAFKNSEINKLTNELTAKNSELNDLKKIMGRQKLSSLYQKGSYLPIGYDAIDIGGSRESILKYYGTPRVITDPKYGFSSISLKIGGIDNITYYFRDENGNKSNKANVVSHIVVFKENSILADEEKRSFLDNLSLKDFLINNLGYIEPCKGDYYVWNFPSKGVAVYYDDSENNSYDIYNNNYAPANFDDECTL